MMQLEHGDCLHPDFIVEERDGAYYAMTPDAADLAAIGATAAEAIEAWINDKCAAYCALRDAEVAAQALAAVEPMSGDGWSLAEAQEPNGEE